MLGFDPEKDCTGLYFKNSKNHWWVGYEGEKKVLIDELPIEANKWIMTYLKQWTDAVPIQVETKGFAVWAQWDEVVVTC